MVQRNSSSALTRPTKQAKRAVILTALQLEYLAVRNRLDDIQEGIHPSGSVYEFGTFTSSPQAWTVGVVEVGAGNVSVAQEVERAINHFKPDVVLFVGVAGGVKDASVGDVVVATKVYLYESGKEADEGFLPRPEIGLGTHPLVQRARAEARKADWVKRVLTPVKEPGPKVFVGAIAAGEKVVASRTSAAYRFLRTQYSDALAVEMEGFGFLKAANTGGIPALVVRGISDVVEGKTKSDEEGSQDMAADRAAAFAYEVLAKLCSEPPKKGMVPALALSVVNNGGGSQARLAPGVTAKRTFRVTGSPLGQICWSPNGEHLALTTSRGVPAIWHEKDQKLTFLPDDRAFTLAWGPEGRFITSGKAVWNAPTWKLSVRTGAQVSRGVAVSSDGRLLAVAGADAQLRFYDSQSGDPGTIVGFMGTVIQEVVWAPDGDRYAVICNDMTVRLLSVKDSAFSVLMRGHAESVTSVAWSPDGKMIATASLDRTVRLWDTATGDAVSVLEGHTDAVMAVTFCQWAPLLASRSYFGSVKLWRYDAEKCLVTLRLSDSEPPAWGGLCFHPKDPLLTCLEDQGKVLVHFELNPSVLLKTEMATVRYSNAKVVLVGDSGVGKSGLGLVLTGQPFAATESTHGRHVRTFETRQHRLPQGRLETRETLLWDLAGQPGYRLVHQLSLNEVAVALVVFDGHSETDPFAGVSHWVRALSVAERVGRGPNIPMTRFLVCARADRGGAGVSQERIASIQRTWGFSGYFETSAREGWQIKELCDAIRRAVPWDRLPRVSSTVLFDQIKSFLLAVKRDGRILASSDELFREFVGLHESVDATDLAAQFDTCIRLVESRGLIRRLSFGNFVLLQPELLDSYASAIVNAAKDQPDGFGCIPEEDVLAGRFRMSEDERVSDKETERLLLLAVTEDFLRHEIALREPSDDGLQLVFPSQFTRDRPEAPEPEGSVVTIQFQGPVMNIYSTLTVRLAHSGFFKKKEMWRNACLFEAKAGGLCGVALRLVDDGHGQLTLFFDTQVSEDTRFNFEEYVRSHISRRAVPDTVFLERTSVCRSCKTPATALQVKRRLDLGHKDMRCNVCGAKMDLYQPEPGRVASTVIRKINRVAVERRNSEAAVTVIKGKMEIGDYDVLLAFQNEDRDFALAIAEGLRKRGINPWLDTAGLPPRQWTNLLLREATPAMEAIAIVVGKAGLRVWGEGEIAALAKSVSAFRVPIAFLTMPGVGKSTIGGEANNATILQFASGSDEQALATLESVVNRSSGTAATEE